MDEKQERFIDKLNAFVEEVKALPRFKGQAQAVAALKRIGGRTAFK